MSKKSFELIVQLGLTALLTMGIASSSARAAPIRFEAELETAKITDVGSVTSSVDGETLTLHLKNGTLQISPFDQTDRTIKIRTVLYVFPDVGPASKIAPASVSEASAVDVTNMKPNYNSTFLTNLNMDAELTEKRTDGTLLYKLKLNPRPIIQQK
jgi:hypothetical protein